VHVERQIKNWWGRGESKLRLTVSMRTAQDRDGAEIACWTTSGHGNLTALTLDLARAATTTGRESDQDWYIVGVLPHNNKDVPLSYNLGYAVTAGA